jgi:outer membrane immunogenic protein
MTRLVPLLIGFSFIAVTSAANAADLMTYQNYPAQSSYMPQSTNWGGFYAGINGGFASGTVDWTGDYIVGGSSVGTDSGSFDTSGWMAGAQLGGNMQLGNFVLGVEGDVDWTNLSGTGGEIDPQNADPSVPSTQLDWLASLRGRAGIAMDSLLLYGTGGLAWGSGSMTITNLDTAGDDRTADVSASGWVAGIGAEVKVSDNMSIRGEYTYTKLTMDQVDFGSVPPADSLAANADMGINAFKVGINFGF